jgi:processive 1,2-diacylglycerol beta-glucosyltransferase
MRVLFLSISMGAGHVKAAEALKEYIDLRYPDSENLIVDTLKYVNPVVHKIIVDGYLNVVKKKPKIYGNLYRMSEYRESIIKLSRRFSNLLASKIYKLVLDFKPSIIVCTHPFPLQMVAHLKNHKNMKIPAVAILTDFVNHPLWFHDNIEAYIVGHDYIKHDMEECGIDKNCIFPYGIPVSRKFLEPSSKTIARSRLSLQNKLTVLLMGGSLGIGDMENSFRIFAESKRDLQIITVAGKNSALEERIKELSKSYNGSFKIFGYTQNIAELMDCSDFIATKAGGMTLSEALVKKLPILIVSPIPGQEERNARFLINSGAAISISKKDNIDSILCQIYDNPLRYRHMKQMAENLSKPEAGHNIVNLMEKLIHDNLFKYSSNTL